MIGNELRFEDVGQERLEEIQEFARTHFDPPHFIPDDFFKHKFRKIRLFTRGGVPIGYCEISLEPQVYPCFSKRTRPRDVWEVMSHYRSWCFEQYGGGSVGVPRDTINFPEHIMSKLGFYRSGNEIYIPID